MKITELPKLELSVYEETLNNGLKIYVIPKKDAKGIYATFTTKYGGGIDEFIPLGGKEYIKVPHGIAHFLEHKMFEQEDGTDPMKFFSERGADSNASTNTYRTSYLFSGSKCFEDNMNYLLDFVQAPYLTEQNVEKEKGIIVQEAKMCLDQPGRRMYDEIMLQLLLKSSNRYSTIGSIEEIKSITKEQLLLCYNTFYHPSNMFVVVTGNVDPEEVIDIICKNQEKKEFAPQVPIKIKKEKEPKEIEHKEVKLFMNVKVPKVSYNLKIDISKLKKEIGERLLYYYVGLIGEVHFSESSILFETLQKDKIVTSDIGGMSMIEGDYLLFTVDTETKNVEEFLKRVKLELRDLSITKEELVRYQRVMISSILKNSDSIYSMNQKIMNQIVHYGDFIPDEIELIRSMNEEDLKKVIKAFEHKENGTVIIYPKEEQ